MKRILILLACCFPLWVQAQQITEAQKQKALQTASQFCELLTKYCGGQRTLTTQIQALCSGADCSVYDDFLNNEETSLNTYLTAIQRKHPSKFVLQVSDPTLSNAQVYYEPEMSASTAWGSMGIGDMSVTTQIPQLGITKYTNAFVVFNITQVIPALQKTTERKLIYDTNAGKISAYITGSGTYLSYLNGLYSMSQKDYRKSITCFEQAASNKRAAFKSRCYFLAMTCSFYLGDTQSALRYSEMCGDPFYEYSLKAALAGMDGQLDGAFSYYSKCLQLIEASGNKYNAQTRGSVYMNMGILYAHSELSQRNNKESILYLKKAMENGEPTAGFFLYNFYACGIYGKDDLTPEEALQALQWSAEHGYPIARYTWAWECIFMNEEEAFKQFRELAGEGNPMAMSCLGALYLRHGDDAEGKEWLRKALSSRRLDNTVKEYHALLGESWPRSRADIQGVLDGTLPLPFIEGEPTQADVQPSTQPQANPALADSTFTDTQPQTPPSSSTSTSASTVTHTGGSSTPSYSYHSRRGGFNEAKDAYWGGLSVGYVQKSWVYEDENGSQNIGMFDDDKYVHGVQAGIRIDPQFNYGLGINTGLFYEYYTSKSDEQTDEYGTYHYRLEEHGLYMPIDFKFTMNFSEWFQLSLYGGIGLDYGVKGKIYGRADGETFGDEDLYGSDSDVKRFNASLEYGGAIRIKRLQLNFTLAKGLIKKTGEGYTVKQNKPFAITATVCF